METRAIVIENYGHADQLKESKVELPELGEHQVLVKVHATSVNPIDWKLREGYLAQMMPWEFPITLGWDVAGEIAAIGSKVKDWQVGQKVFARPETTRFGTYADYTIVDDHLLARKPDNVSFEEAAAVPLAGLTAYQALFTHGQLKAGEKVLIHAGAGGVGIYAIQLAKNAGATVITTASEKNHALLKELGADQVIDYHTTDFSEVLENVDLVFDTMGGEVQANSFKILNEQGRLISIVGQPDEELAKTVAVAESIWLQPNGEQLQVIADLMAAGKVKSVIGHTYPLTAAGVKEAHELSATHHAKGKIVLTNE
ncbi:NADP-dependent oxidoreductase [Enterococcus devriesei]|uniref:NADP-dependent oxidoreductase n=1 Tax=Enterococcus devriesei TaxID=319970 RepID=UPI001C107BE2|nr:NADP-dependent oxidoreductase [Enterococcus devriesei]MBU5363945.1 NADP-dependent oxidoreductase [Enterococcus devriesei]MDT2822199.1 NADP-dependent oxidoreductase [Enterococcus devriesei]